MSSPSPSPESTESRAALNVLFLEDDSRDAELIQTHLREVGRPCQVTQVKTREAFQSALEGSRPDLILADDHLPQFDGKTALDLARQLRPDVPFLFVCGAIREEQAIESLRSGATDIVLKNRLDRLVPAILQALGEARERGERQRLEKELQQNVLHLAELDRHKNQFLAVLAHELRNPLAPIRYSLPLIRAACSSEPEAAGACAVVERQVRLLTQMVDDLLDAFCIIHHQVHLRKETLNLVDLVRQAVADRRLALQQAGLDLVLDLPGQPVPVEADATRLIQVMNNLLINAVKFNRVGGRVTVRLTPSEDGRRAMVSVSDTGEGIDPDRLPFVFDAFARLEDYPAPRHGGLGLGLALVKGFVEQHGGEVVASSPGQGQGAEISFWLPAAQAEVTSLQVSPSRALARSLKILIVEDNLDAARSLKMLLRRAGHEVVATHCGLDGLEAAHRMGPDVVLCDLGLPEMDGFEVARRLRADPDTAEARLIAITGHGLEEDRRRSEAAGFDLHLTKPVDPLELQRLLAVLKVRRD